MRILLFVSLLLLTAGQAGAQCCGDCSGDGNVTINDLITAVNNALNGCAAVTPTGGTPATPTRTPTPTRQPTATRTPNNRCPSTFSTQGSNLCLFNGTFNRSCGGSLNGTFSSNGRLLFVTLATNLVQPPTVSFSANVTSATTATLVAWSSDDFQTSRPTTGSVTLNNNGAQLVVFPDNPPFMIQSCNFVQYLGAYQAPRRAAERAADGGVIDLADR
ncbi:hypothetical protein KF840_07775 [bacterium]|nr:hypothetical protein [bacterium]